MSDAALEHLAHVRKVRDYFARQAVANPLFAPERDAAQRVVCLMEVQGPPDTAAILAQIAALEGTEHYDGTGWLDFQMGVHAWIRAIGATRPTTT